MHGKTRKSLGVRRTQKYVGMTKDEAQRSRWTFYEVVTSFQNPRAVSHRGNCRILS